MRTARLLTADEVADILGVSTATLAKWRQTGDSELPYLRINGRVRYRASDVEDFLDSAEQDDDEEPEDDDEDDDDDDAEDDEAA